MFFAPSALAMRPVLLSLTLLVGSAAAQTGSCDTEAHGRYDFWVGTWDLMWSAGPDSLGRGTNTISKSYNGCVIEERFEDAGGFEGMSVSTLDRRSGQWLQTWTDNQASVLRFTGGTAEDGAPTFEGTPFTNPQGAEQVNRMTWRNITDDALDWHWQRSLDGGETWTDLWVIHYARRR